MRHHPEITDTQIQIFVSVILGGEIDLLRATDDIKSLPLKAQDELRAACLKLNNLIEQIQLKKMSKGSDEKMTEPRLGALPSPD